MPRSPTGNGERLRRLQIDSKFKPSWLGLTLEAGRDGASKFADAQLFNDIGAAPTFPSCKSRIKDARLPYAAGSAVNESKLPFKFGADTRTSPCHDLGATADSRFCFNQRHGR